MASHRRTPAQMTLVDGIESWYMPAAGARGHLRRVVEYARFIESPSDQPARRLIETETREALARLEQFVAAWEMFWSLVYGTERMDVAALAGMLAALRERMDDGA